MREIDGLPAPVDKFSNSGFLFDSVVNRLLGLFLAILIGLWAQRMLTGPDPGIPRDALILFIIAGVIFALSARPPRVLRPAPVHHRIGRRWPLAAANRNVPNRRHRRPPTLATAGRSLIRAHSSAGTD